MNSNRAAVGNLHQTQIKQWDVQKKPRQRLLNVFNTWNCPGKHIKSIRTFTATTGAQFNWNFDRRSLIEDVGFRCAVWSAVISSLSSSLSSESLSFPYALAKASIAAILVFECEASPRLSSSVYEIEAGESWQRAARGPAPRAWEGGRGMGRGWGQVFGVGDLKKKHFLCSFGRSWVEYASSMQNVRPSWFRRDSPDFDWESRIPTRPQSERKIDQKKCLNGIFRDILC